MIKAKSKDTFIIILLCTLASANTIPYLLLTSVQQYIYLGVFLICLCIYLFQVMQMPYIRLEHLIRWTVFILMLLIPILAGNSTYTNRYLFLSGAILYIMMHKCFSEKHYKYTITILTIISCVISVQTLIVLSNYSYASRVADYNINMQRLGVGGYNFIYAIMLGAILLFANIIDKKSDKLKWAKIIVFSLFFITVSKSQFMTAILIMLIGLILCIVFRSSDTRGNRIIKTLFFILCAILIFIFLENLLDILSLFLQKLTTGSESGRVIDLISRDKNLLNTIKEEFISDRLPVIQQSIAGISEHPIIGNIVAGLDEASFGNHSTIFDTISLWGVPLGLVYVYLMFCPFFQNERIKNKAYTIPFVASFALLSIFNNLECTTIFVIYFIGIYVIDKMNIACQNS